MMGCLGPGSRFLCGSDDPCGRNNQGPLPAPIKDHLADIRKFESAAKKKDQAADYAKQTLPTLRKYLETAETLVGAPRDRADPFERYSTALPLRKLSSSSRRLAL